MQIENIKEYEQFMLWRKRKRIRLEDIATYCNCSISTISRWENGIKALPNVILAKYKEYINKFDEVKN